MKNIFALILLLFSANLLFALQDDRLDDFSFESSELKHESTPYFAIAGGATFTFQFANFDEVNSLLTTKNFGTDEFSGQVNLWGGEGFTGLVYIPNMRAGFFSYGGSKTVSGEFEANAALINREVEYRVGITGISLEYALVPLKSFAVVGGVSLGRGDLSVSTFETPSESGWNDYNPEVDPYNFTNTISTNYWLVKPNIHLEYALTNFLMFRVGASYNLTFGTDWKQNNNSTLNGVPDAMNANALQIQAGIFVGLFNY
ncbi:MAG: hypothetical protein WC313_08550 [Candidatus Kapaibacterium sp.]